MSTGIGLTHVKELVESYYNGQIYVESEIEKGTVFKVYLPMKYIQHAPLEGGTLDEAKNISGR